MQFRCPIFGALIPQPMTLTPLEEAAIEAEYNAIVEALKIVDFNKSKAAILLQIDRKTLYNKIRIYKEMKAAKAATKTIPDNR